MFRMFPTPNAKKASKLPWGYLVESLLAPAATHCCLSGLIDFWIEGIQINGVESSLVYVAKHKSFAWEVRAFFDL